MCSSDLKLEISTPEIFLDYLGAEISNLSINGNPIDVDFHDGRIYLHDLPTGEEVTVKSTVSPAIHAAGKAYTACSTPPTVIPISIHT